jgi:hypothetical protein
MLGTLGSDEHSTDLEHLTLSGMPAPEQDPRVCTPGQSIAQFFKLLTRSDLTEYFESLRLKIKAELEHAALDRNQ